MSLSTQTTVGQLVAQRPGRSRLFEKLGIDYCCGGKLPLAQACEAKGLDAATVVTMLQALDESGGEAGAGAPVDAAAMDLAPLCDHIEATHHAMLKRELPRLSAMTRRVAAAHGMNHPETMQIAEVFDSLMVEMTSHMGKEEQILFPLIRQLDAARAAGACAPDAHCGSIANPIRVMEHEHDSAGNALARMRELSHGFTPPPDACNTYRAMLGGLADIEADMHQHVHKENNVLFPRALAMEEQLTA